MPIVLIILLLVALYIFWDYIIYMIGGGFVIFAIFSLYLAYEAHKESKQSAIVVSLIIALISGGIGYKIIDYNSNKITLAEQNKKEDIRKQKIEAEKKIELLSPEDKERYNIKYQEFLSNGKTDSEAKELAYSEVEIYQNQVKSMNKKIDELEPDLKNIFNERYQSYLSEGIHDNDAREKALNDALIRQKEMKDAKEKEEKLIAKEKEINKKIASFNDTEKELYENKYTTYATTMDDITAKEKALSDVKDAINDNKKRVTKEFLESEQPFKKEAEARFYSSAYQRTWKVHQVYAEVMAEYVKKIKNGDNNAKEVREACLAYYSCKGVEALASYEAEKKDMSLDKLKIYLKKRELNETAEEAEKKIRSLASWSGANLK